MDGQTVILHHYDVSPFSEKLRLALNLKGIPWRSCIHSWIMPRPFLTPDLTGTFRRIPVLQIGADIFCDTVAVLPALDKLFPSHPMNPSDIGLYDSIYHITDFKGWFGYLVSSMPWTKDVKTENKSWAEDVQSDAFLGDRETLLGKIPTDAMAAGAPLWRAQLHAHLDSLDRTLLASKTGWIMSTEGPSTVDIHFSNPVWFFREQGTNADLLGKYPRVTQWLARLESEAAQNKHPDAGKPISPEEARTIAVESGAAGAFLPLDSEWNDANDRQSGDFVGVSSDEFRGLNKPFFCEGELVESTPRGFAVKFTTEAGVEVVHHYPRFGYDVVPIKEE